MRTPIVPRVAPFLLLCAFLAFLPSCGPSSRTAPSPVDMVTIPAQLNFFEKLVTNPATKTLDIGVTNRVSVAWSVRAREPWLSITPTRGETPRNFTGALPTSRTTVSADTSNLSPGTYSTNISIDVDGQTVRVVPVTLYVTSLQPGDLLDVKIEQIGKAGEPGWPEGMELASPVETSVIVLDTEDTDGRDLTALGPGESTVAFGAGDMALLVNATIRNSSPRTWIFFCSAAGFDSEGNRVSSPLSEGFEPFGNFHGAFGAGSEENFRFRLSWADNITTIRIGFQVQGEMGVPPSIPPLPESEIARIIFPKNWLLANDAEPDPSTLKITFPRSWLHNAPPLPEGETAIRLIVPYLLLEEHNESKNPEELTVVFPVRYFEGL